MLKSFIVAAFALFAFSAHAKESVLIVTPGSPTGASGTTAREFGKVLEIKYNVRFVSTDGNCALAKSLYENTPGIRFYVSATTIPGSFEKGSACLIEPTRQNWIGVTQIGPLQFCAAGDKTLDDLLRRGATSRVLMTMQDSNKLFDELEAHYGFKTRRVFHANASINNYRQMARAGEIDFGWQIGINNVPETKRCFFNTDNLYEKFPFLRGQYTHLKDWTGVVIGTGFNNRDEFVNALGAAYRGNTLVELRRTRAVDSTLTDWNTPDEWLRIREKFFHEFWE